MSSQISFLITLDVCKLFFKSVFIQQHVLFHSILKTVGQFDFFPVTPKNVSVTRVSNKKVLISIRIKKSKMNYAQTLYLKIGTKKGEVLVTSVVVPVLRLGVN